MANTSRKSRFSTALSAHWMPSSNNVRKVTSENYPTELGLEGVEWKELIKPHLLGCLNFSREEVEKVNLNTLRAEIVMDGISVRISSGLGVINTDNKEPDNAFILDCEYYQVGKLNMDEIGEVAEGLHQKSTDFFRKSITRKLHEAMEPQELK